jgi:hypothetical protein
MLNDLSYSALLTEGQLDPHVWHTQLYEILCLPHAQDLAVALQGHGFKYMVIRLDECLHWNQESPAVDRYEPTFGMSLITFQHIVKAADSSQLKMGGFTFWYTLLGTSSAVFDLVPRMEDGASTRLGSTLEPLHVWPYLGFNQMALSTPSETPDAAPRPEGSAFSVDPYVIFNITAIVCPLYSPVASFGRYSRKIPFD